MRIIIDQKEQEHVFGWIDSGLPDHYRVLDLGGAAYPLCRADWIVDQLAFVQRGGHGHYGVSSERVTADSWVMADLCSPSWPQQFGDQSFDVVFCGHTLEDVECPKYVVDEMCRIGKSCVVYSPHWTFEIGDISKFFSQTWMGAGYSHHHWLIAPRDNEINFIRKPNWLPKEEYPIVSRYIMATWEERIDSRELIYSGEPNRAGFIEWVESLSG